MNEKADVLIVGAGIAGLALALRLGQEGLRVTLVDKTPLPRDKVCGEALMPLGVEALRALGLDPAILPGADFGGLEYRTVRQRTMIRFPPGLRGRGIRRTALLDALQQKALGRDGVCLQTDRIRAPVWEDGRIVGALGTGRGYRARVVVAADGVHSGLARAAGLMPRPRGERLALRRHYALAAESEALVRIALFAPYDLYITPTGPGEVLATTMTDRAGYRAIVGGYERFLRGSPFGELFVEARPASRLLGWHHPLFAPSRYHAAGLLLAGDAGGGVDPCLGLGMSMALDSARFAAEAVCGLLAEPGRAAWWESRFDRQRRSSYQHIRKFDAIFGLLLRSRTGAKALLWGMRHWPGVADALLTLVATGGPWGAFPWRTLVAPVRG